MSARIWTGLLLVAVGCTDGAISDPLPVCEAGQVLQQSGEGWTCATLPPTAEGNALSKASLECQDGQVPRVEGGQWMCATVTSDSGGDVSGVSAGAGLLGGGQSGELQLQVDFAGSGSGTKVARSDHAHGFMELSGVPPGFLDLVDNDVLGSLSCTTDQLPRYSASRASWECWTPPPPPMLVEADPTVNSLARASVMDGCADGQVPLRASPGWTCHTPLDADTLASLSCADGELASWSASSGQWGCSPAPEALPENLLTSVAAGEGLSVTRDGGSVQLAVNFAGTCASGTVACGDATGPAPTPALDAVLTQGNDAAGQRIANLGAPTSATDAVTKGYVDALAGGSAASSSLVLCCGSGCSGRLPGFNCDAVGQNGTLVIPMPDRRGMIAVPENGRPRVLAANPPTTLEDGGIVSGDVLLEDCATEWNVCTQSGFTSVLLTCGVFNSSQNPTPWLVTAPPMSYVLVPGVKGVLFVDGTDTANEYLDDQFQSSTPASVIDCSAAAPLPGPGVKTAVGFR